MYHVEKTRQFRWAKLQKAKVTVISNFKWTYAPHQNIKTKLQDTQLHLNVDNPNENIGKHKFRWLLTIFFAASLDWLAADATSLRASENDSKILIMKAFIYNNVVLKLITFSISTVHGVFWQLS